MKLNDFKEKCFSSSEYSISFEEKEDRKAPYAFEDDGALHIHFRKFRACFDIEDDRAEYQNANALRVLQKLGLEDLYGPLVIRDEYPDYDENECCPHCGYDYGGGR